MVATSAISTRPSCGMTISLIQLPSSSTRKIKVVKEKRHTQVAHPVGRSKTAYLDRVGYPRLTICIQHHFIPRACQLSRGVPDIDCVNAAKGPIAAFGGAAEETHCYVETERR